MLCILRVASPSSEGLFLLLYSMYCRTAGVPCRRVAVQSCGAAPDMADGPLRTDTSATAPVHNGIYAQRVIAEFRNHPLFDSCASFAFMRIRTHLRAVADHQLCRPSAADHLFGLVSTRGPAGSPTITWSTMLRNRPCSTTPTVWMRSSASSCGWSMRSRCRSTT